MPATAVVSSKLFTVEATVASTVGVPPVGVRITLKPVAPRTGPQNTRTRSRNVPSEALTEVGASRPRQPKSVVPAAPSPADVRARTAYWYVTPGVAKVSRKKGVDVLPTSANAAAP